MIRIFWKAPNYVMAFVFCMAGTIMAALTKDPDWYWLLISDANVAIWLLVAYWLDPNVRKGEGEV